MTREARNLPPLVVHVRPGPACGVWHLRGRVCPRRFLRDGIYVASRRNLRASIRHFSGRGRIAAAEPASRRPKRRSSSRRRASRWRRERRVGDDLQRRDDRGAGLPDDGDILGSPGVRCRQRIARARRPTSASAGAEATTACCSSTASASTIRLPATPRASSCWRTTPCRGSRWCAARNRPCGDRTRSAA
jgi:hypothetical protein